LFEYFKDTALGQFAVVGETRSLAHEAFVFGHEGTRLEFFSGLFVVGMGG